MLINLSNHPKTIWSKEQLALAEKEYSFLVDISFPKIAPDATIDYINKLAEHYLSICIQKISDCSDENNAVHLMGELTFCNALANKLKQNKIKVIASTTERVSIDTLNGKLSKFKFVQFREYYNE